MKFIRPAALVPGDTIAVLSPSWGGPAAFPHLYDHGLEILRREFDVTVKEYPTTRAPDSYLWAHPRSRAEDINAAFADPEVNAIVASIGGDDSVRILPFVDRDVIRQNPKILMGYSDTSTLLTYCNQLGLVTFHGPSIMAGFAQLSCYPAAFAEHIRAMLFDAPPTYTYQPYEVWTEGFPDWGGPGSLGQINPLQSNQEGWHWLQGDGTVQGELWGGCIEVLEFMKATTFWPTPDFWAGKVLFLETSEDVPTPSQVKYMLRNYGMQGIFDQIAALLFGRARDYTPSMKHELDATVVSVVAGEFGRSHMPIVTNFDFGHTDPQVIVPLGVKVEVAYEQQTVVLMEPACHA